MARRTRPRRRRSCGRRGGSDRRAADAAGRADVGEVRGDRRQRPRHAAAARSRRADGALPRSVPFRLRAHAGRQHLRRARHARGLPHQVRGAVPGAARQGRQVLRRARQPRRSQPGRYAPFNMHGERYYTLRAAGGRDRTDRDARRVLRARFDQPRSRRSCGGSTSGSRKSGATWKICLLHHPLYTSGRYRDDVARIHRWALEPIFIEARRQRRVLGPRAHLPADRAAERHSVLRQRRRRIAARRRRHAGAVTSRAPSTATITSC